MIREKAYHHVQKSPIPILIGGVALMFLILGLTVDVPFIAKLGFVFGACMFGWLASSFGQLTIEDYGEGLLLTYGPLPLFKKRFLYDEMTSVEASQSRLIDGFGIHYVPGRGWTYNIWGFDCALIGLGNRSVRVGTDDVDGLVGFLQARLSLVSDGRGPF